jgi:NAD(P)-dependent dehydrogenase (short-subunit alcohol dehydrogenase family)
MRQPLALELAPVRGNVVMPGAIAQAILFLMTNPYVTGHTLIIDGGYVAM